MLQNRDGYSPEARPCKNFLALTSWAVPKDPAVERHPRDPSSTKAPCIFPLQALKGSGLSGLFCSPSGAQCRGPLAQKMAWLPRPHELWLQGNWQVCFGMCWTLAEWWGPQGPSHEPDLCLHDLDMGCGPGHPECGVMHTPLPGLWTSALSLLIRGAAQRTSLSLPDCPPSLNELFLTLHCETEAQKVIRARPVMALLSSQDMGILEIRSPG